jgi:hypothetical protein
MSATGMLMPKAAVDKDYALMPWQNDIRRAGELAGMQAESKAQCVKQLSDCKLRLRILLPNRPQDVRAGWISYHM